MDSIQKRSPVGVSLFLAASVIAAVVAVVPARSTSAASMTPTVSSYRAAPVQLADEITRRLRRMGITFSRTRLPHPYDPAGEIC